ncbi:alpha/beta hydrolase [Embleya sp. NPDC059237]|uniref:alpha/beta hydrolase n=1 Tax=Embleya sp. NPDC059237 TaxID=3346784 RepID=UPI0036A5F042
MSTSIFVSRARRIIPAGLVLALAVGCGGSGGGSDSKATPRAEAKTQSPATGTSAPAGTTPPTAKPIGADDPALKEFYGRRLTWAKCPDDKLTKADEGMLECAKLPVPLDYANPSAETIELQAYRRKATGERLGILAVDPGGPGSGVQGMTAGFAQRPALGERYDIVGIDPRGTGGSNPVTCVDDAGTDRYKGIDPTPDDPAELERITAYFKEFADGCTARSGRMLAHLGTEDVVRDLDVLRGVLGEDKLNYFGYSYGTFLGAVYVEKFPAHSGRVVLDAPMDPALDRVAAARSQAQGFERTFRAFLTDCLRQRDCPLDGTVDEATGKLADRLHQLGRTPLTTAQGRTIGEGEVVNAISQGIYSDRFWKDLRITLRAYLGNDAAKAAAETDLWLGRDRNGAYPRDHTAANLTINCADGRSLTIAEADRLAREVEATMPITGPGVAWSFAADCRPAGTDRVRPIQAPGAPPVLVIGSTGDPATPYEQAQALTPQLPGAVLLTREADGHGSYNKGSACIDGAVETYLVKGELPAAGTRCR